MTAAGEWTRERIDEFLARVVAHPSKDRTLVRRRVRHRCGHLADVVIWGRFMLKERFDFDTHRECPVCMMYSGGIYCRHFTRKSLGMPVRDKKAGGYRLGRSSASLIAMERAVHQLNISG